MDARKLVTNRRSLILLIAVILLLITPQAALANIRLDSGGQVPYYARIAEGEFYADGDWVAIVFYRQPDCVPENFDLLQFFDFANVWGCEPTTSGFEIWKNGPGVDMAPLQQQLFGLGAVPVWFVSMEDLQAAIDGDGKLKIGELAAMPSLKIGSASFYHETLHPWGGSVRNHQVFNAHGLLTDETGFKVHAEHTEANFKVSIRFDP